MKQNTPTHLQAAKLRAEETIPPAERSSDWEQRWARFSAVLGEMEAEVVFDRDEKTGLLSPRVDDINISGLGEKLDRLIGKGRRKR